jgi:hypothetical protein
MVMVEIDYGGYHVSHNFDGCYDDVSVMTMLVMMTLLMMLMRF